MEKRNLLFYSVFTLIATLIIVISGIVTEPKVDYPLRGDYEPYSIVFNQNTNKFFHSVNEPTNGSSVAKTGLGNDVLVAYQNVSDSNAYWHTIHSGGFVENSDPVSGMLKMSITKLANANIGVYWSETSLFDENHYVEFLDSGPTEVFTTFNDERPNYFKIVSVGMSISEIASINIEFNCIFTESLGYTFGMYPQTEVEDQALIATLNNAAGPLPSEENSEAWTSYRYYNGGQMDDYTWYIDVAEDGELYRGVYFTYYRSDEVTMPRPYNTSSQEQYGYFINTRYWFKFEPILWDVLSVAEDGSPFLLSNKILDGLEYYDDCDEIRTIDGQIVYAHNYKESNVRTWLNDSFLTTAFTGVDQSKIKISNVDNSAYSTGDTLRESDNTNDKIFLLSYREATNSVFGFSTEDYAHSSRLREATDYAKALGAVFLFTGGVSWWLRSPSYGAASGQFVYYDGRMHEITVSYVLGILPALRLDL